MKNVFRVLLPVIILFAVLGTEACKEKPHVDPPEVKSSELIHDAMKHLSDVIVHDIFSPPVASRIYAYASIASYEVLAKEQSSYKSFAGQLREMPSVPNPPEGVVISYPVAATEALNQVGKALTFSADLYDPFIEEQRTLFREMEISKKVYQNSLEYGQAVANHILEWAKGDNYNQSRSFPKYSINNNDPATWKPTPPAYMEGIEPHWRDIRPMVLDSAQQFKPDHPTDFNLKKGSRFYNETMEVYEAVKDAGEEEVEIANFWDCNPYKMNIIGHVMHATKKITPGGHWIGIVGVACKKIKADQIKSIQAYALTSVALFDGFISCWDEKYRSVLVRPETVINEEIDPDWVPLLQTPPFPEYTSGHSVVSRAAAVALTGLFGDNFMYEDDVEVEYGLPIRKFKSFYHASEEAAISRLYGGIHYRPAIDQGVVQGQQVGEYLMEKIDLGG